MTAERIVPSLLPQPGTHHLAARDVARQHAPSTTIDDDGAEFREAWKHFADFGVFRLTIPDAGLDVDTVLNTLEGLGEGTRNAGFLLSIGAHSFAAGAAISQFGSEGQRQVLDRMRDGSVIAAFASTESEAGSDVMSLRTRCVAVDDDYVLDGTKHFITNAWLADYFVVFATKDRRLNWRGVTAFLVPRDTPGLSVGPPQRLIGLSSCSMSTVNLDSVRVPRSAMLGRLGHGSLVFRHAMLWERSLLAALALGAMRRQLTEVIDAALAHQRAAASASDPDVVCQVVDIGGRYLVGQLLVRDTVTKLAASTLTPGQASLTKLWISEAELATSRELAATGTTTELVSGSRTGELLNAVGATIYSGTSDIQRKIIAAELGIFQ
ncbi:MAG TPA: acyl-CoA dehydrogenase family protein [Streptosporangiaceae bacterium]|nr:acyl-CoA dehydrogenase family protein [Streptosporangiaceae bacterium]